MQRKDLITTLHTASEKVRPDAKWKSSNRDILVSQITAQTGSGIRTERGNAFLPILRTLRFAVKPAIAVAIIASVSFGSYIATVSATKNSLPGDFFYPVKLTSERVQVNLERDRQKKVALEISFAGRRIEELQKLQQDPAVKKENIAVPLQKFKENVIQAKDHLEQVKLENRDVAAALADTVENKTDEFISILEGEQKDVTSSQAIKDAILVTKDTNTAAVTLIIKNKTAEPADAGKQEALAKVEEKLAKTQLKVANISQKIASIEELYAAEALAEAATETEDMTDDASLTEDATAELSREEHMSSLKAGFASAQSVLAEAEKLLDTGTAENAFMKITEADRQLFEIENALDDLFAEATATVGEEVDDAATDTTAPSDTDTAVEDTETDEMSAAEDAEELPESQGAEAPGAKGTF